MAAEDRCRSDAAREKRREQLNRWLVSDTERSVPPGGPGSSRRPGRVRFAQGAVFMAACSAGDREEVRQLLAAGAPINGTNVDGLTALHQACIDENMDMVQFLVENGAMVNQPDNEGWTPLHAAASCGFVSIAQYLISKGASVAAVNSEGELPLDVSHESAMEKLLKSEIKKQGVDLDIARREEEEIMLRDARLWLNNGKYEDARHPTTGATALHVAAAKGYTEVIKLLLQLGFDVDSRDFDGWTPLHAAAHWGQQDACRLLCEALCDMEAVNKVGQTAADVADDSIESLLEELKDKQSVLRVEKMKNAPQILSPTGPPNQSASSKTRSQEKVALRVQDKERRAQPSTMAGTTTQPIASSSDAESGSDAESEKVKAQERINNLNNQLRNLSGTAAKKPPVTQDQAKAEPASGSWRASLRKTGSSSALSSGTVSEEGRRAALPKSASSSQLSEREKTGAELRLARVPPSQKLLGDQENPPLSRGSLFQQRYGEDGLASLRRQRGEALTAKTETPVSKREFLTSKPEPSVSAANTTPAKTDSNVSAPNALGRRTDVSNAASTTTTSTTTATTNLETTHNPETKERRRSYLTPVRDEEAEAQRKARSRHARQSRRSTQGVTLTDLKEAEKVIKGQQENKEAEPEPVKTQEEESNKDNQSKARSSRGSGEDSSEVSWRARIASLQKSDLLGLTTPDSAPTSHRRAAGQALESKELQKSQEDEKESDERGGRNKAGVRDRRRPRGKRRSTGVPQTTKDSDGEESEEEDGEEEKPRAQVDGLGSRADNVFNSHTSSRAERTLGAEHRDTKDFKKLYEDLVRDNGRLRSQLLNTQNLVNETKAELERATQRQERSVDRSFLIDTEKKEKIILERRVSELHEEMKVLGDLKADNQRLKDENGALIRVISKLSK
ncbi:protein phosphatase 1 regulatory subunit 12A-like isoform X2 [Spea bombifrons]|uniref:protein phosphatase 1 regulatory subunit 12A-like isoform X2 n=1 Tax=Spea bombifrons TaxID=233779 RepID=UPI00234AC78E|nr:protein phosphatase 1 regulatory subunit 12A-like isoform X2 [Spea bombifrons]